jgi:hypothetical protein
MMYITARVVVNPANLPMHGDKQVLYINLGRKTTMKANYFVRLCLKSAGLLQHRMIRAFLIVIAAVTIVVSCGPVLGPTDLPADVKTTCIDTTGGAPAMATWFESGSITLNGVVKPADSVNFPDVPNCSFYQWSEQMFLWLTSPAPTSYGGGGGRIFASPVFYDVTPPDSGGDRTFIEHQPGRFNLFLRTAQVGPHSLKVIQDTKGDMIELIPPVLSADGQPLVLNGVGERIAVANITVDNGKALFLDNTGKVIDGARLILPPELTGKLDTEETPQVNPAPNPDQLPVDEAHIAQLFIFGERRFFINLAGNALSVEQGQAGGNAVLEAQTGSLVYYATTVNDVFAYFLTGAKNGGITPTPTRFPTTQTELDSIKAFAIAHGKPSPNPFPDPEALAIEVKTAWVEASGLTNPDSYIKMRGTIPTYDTSNPNEWVPTGEATVELAMVSMHVVGSTKGHPEMIWATFEHINATPHAGYSYKNTSNVTVTVAQDTSGAWLFSRTSSTGPFNEQHMFWDDSSSHILSFSPFTISASDTMRTNAWGKANPSDPSTIASNTEVISINNSVRGQLISADVRSNYIMTGATWTIFGAPPNSSNQVGTNKLANTTMETYQTGSNCFSCHTGDMLGDNFGGGISHIYGKLKPLFP